MTHETLLLHLDAWWATLTPDHKAEVFGLAYEAELRDQAPDALPFTPQPLTVQPNAWIGVLHGILAEKEYFDPEAIRASLGEYLPHGLAGIAEAMRQGKITARCLLVEPHGLGKPADPRIHLRIVLDLAAEPVRVLQFPAPRALEVQS